MIALDIKHGSEELVFDIAASDMESFENIKMFRDDATAIMKSMSANVDDMMNELAQTEDISLEVVTTFYGI